MRLIVVAPVAVLAICALAIGLALQSGARLWPTHEQVAPRSGLQILSAHTCARGETKRIIVRGNEDGFSPAGVEPGLIRPGRNYGAYLPRAGAGAYDQTGADQSFADSFPVEGPVSGGILLFRVRGLGGSKNDSVAFGNLSLRANEASPRSFAGFSFASQGSHGEWRTEGEVRYANIADVVFYSPPAVKDHGPEPAGATAYTLQSYLNDPDRPGWLDVFVQDDTAVDFMGMALCSPPARHRGASLTPIAPPAGPDIVQLTCHHVREAGRQCEPYVGDTDCSVALPVACIRPGDAPSPTNARGELILPDWSGGDIAVTEPVAGDRFRSVRDVERFCAQRFGPRWRVADIEDGMRNLSISGHGDPRSIRGRVWVHVANQPHATCWARE